MLTRLRRRKKKVFCIGRNKTGTTSLEALVRDLGYAVGDQARGELLLEDWAAGDFEPIIRLCESADFFQDIPFSLPKTYEAVDGAFPASRFILTVRPSAEEWFDSLVRFHTRLIGKGRQPTEDDLRAFEYRAPGWIWNVQRLVYGIDETALYDRDVYIQHYERHNSAVRQYFRDRPSDLLEVDLSHEDALERIGRFLGHSTRGRSLPHLNRSE